MHGDSFGARDAMRKETSLLPICQTVVGMWLQTLDGLWDTADKEGNSFTPSTTYEGQPQHRYCSLVKTVGNGLVVRGNTHLTAAQEPEAWCPSITAPGQIIIENHRHT